MTILFSNLKSRARWPLRLLACCVLIAAALSVAFPHEALAGNSSASDDFDRADGPLGPDWTDIGSGGLVISSGSVAGTAATGLTGDSWSADSFSSDQFSQVQTTATQLSGGQWIGPAVRVQGGGQDAYVGIYYWNNGSPDLMLFMESGGGWTQLGSTYNSGALAAGTQLQVSAVGSAISFLENGIVRITATNSTLSGGAPGILSYGTGTAGDWSGGDASTSGYTVGGTVSGLSGTVVLQDNGGDTLSVSANGGFTFATSLANGTAYDVTVLTYPSGQTCSVSNGTGTIAAANVAGVTVTCTTGSPVSSASDDFDRADGPLGPDWTDIGSGGLVISSGSVAGTAATGLTGDSWSADSFSSDQFSQVQTTATQLSGGQWIGPAVRVQGGGQDAYVGIYYWNNGSPDLMLFMESGGGWTQLGSTYNSGALAAGTQLQVSAVGSAISFLENGIVRITATNSTLSGGAPGILSYGTGTAGDWSGGDASAGGGGSGGGGATYTVGGTVSGLSGTVVLQDNGGDTLSVSANGGFTFATSLANGTAYDVTVLTYPSGQTCSVSNGTGTIAAANVAGVTVTCTTGSPVSSASDDFDRADGPLGPDWTAISDGALAIASDAVTGTTSGLTGAIRTAETYDSNQYSQIEVTSTPLSGSQWIGAAVRVQGGGQDAYVGLYSWDNGRPDLELFLRSDGGWTELTSPYASGALAAGTQLRIEAVGSTIAFLENGVQRLAVGDTNLSGGAPGIMINGTGTAGHWSGGTAGFQVNYLYTDSTGIQYYDVISANDSDGPQVLRVLQPTHPAAGVAHNFLFVLPVEAGLGSTYGDGLATLQSLDAEDTYNLTLIEPSFAIDPWYADNPVNPDVQYQTFMTQELVPWVQQNLSTTGSEQNWLIGFSKSGIGGQDLILKYPNLFTLAASWDFPADMSSYDEFNADSEAAYGTNANFQANYELSQAFVDAHKGPFLTSNRIWIGGYSLYQTDDSDYDNLLTAEGIAHTTETPTDMDHTWDSGWVPLAMAALFQDSQNLSP